MRAKAQVAMKRPTMTKPTVLSSKVESLPLGDAA